MKFISAFICPWVVKRRGAKLEKELKSQMTNIRASQEALLLSIVGSQKDTDFGREHSFAEIKSLEDFQNLVPVLDYEKLRPYIMKQDQTGHPALLSETPIFYAVTSGTTGEPKYIPVHEKALKAHRSCTDFFVYNLLKAKPRLLSGKILAIVSPAVEGRLPSGRAFGATSGHMYEGLPNIIKKKYIVPSEVFAIEDYDLKYLTILRLALQAKDITYLTTANPSTIAKLMSLIEPHFESLVNGIEKGTFSEMDRLEAKIQNAVAERLEASPKRAAELRDLKQNKTKMLAQDIWPDIQVLGVWTGGSSSIFLDQLAGHFSESTLVRDLGYLSSEFRGSVPVLSETNAGVPTFWNCVYEFVEQSSWDSGDKKFLTLDQLENNKNYYVFITTDYGLYRYNMNDIVQVDGFYENIPMIRFLQKGKGVTSITGEKLYENQVIQAVMQAEKEFEIDSQFYIMSCVPEEARYTLYYEVSPDVKNIFLDRSEKEAFDATRTFQARVDELLSQINIEYDAKRKSGRVKPMRLCILKKQSYDVFKKFYLATGLREGQFKIVALQFAKDIKFDFSKQIGWDSDNSDTENSVLRAAVSSRKLKPVQYESGEVFA
jgi:hypothetical protein